jgi:hypothetical protein
MLKNDIVLAFKQLGWRIFRNEGERLASFDIQDTQIELVFRLYHLPLLKVLECNNSLTTLRFTIATAKISSKKNSHEPLIVANERLRQPDFTLEDIRALSARLIEWAKSQDIDAALQRLRALPTDAKGAYPRRHLAALALVGDVEKLEYYQRSFESGDRLGFVPYISKEMIDRAVEIAKDAAQSTSA